MPSSVGSTTFYESNPTYTDAADDADDWSTSTPQRQRFIPARLDQGLAALADEPSLLSVLVVRHGQVVAERYLHGAGPRTSNNIHSASKSMMQALVGIAVDLGFLSSIDDAVAKYLPQYVSNDGDPGKLEITLRSLLTMSSGLAWREDNSEDTIHTAPDWVRAIFSLPLQHDPSTVFNYSTGDTHLLSAVLQHATGMTTYQFAHRYLFGPLSITVEHWGRDPQGVYSGGYNLYLTAREMAKFGLVYLNRGTWRGRQIVPAATVDQAMSRAYDVDANYGYSQGWWMRRIHGHDVPFAWGYGGQFIYVIPQADIIVVTSQDTKDGHSNSEIDHKNFIDNFIMRSLMR